MLAAAQGLFPIGTDPPYPLSPHWPDQLQRYAAAVQLQRDWGWWNKPPWSDLKLLRSPIADFQAWLDRTSAAVAAPEAEPYRTGLAGRPTSWSLVEAESRRRWGEGERHQGKAGPESPTEWARILSDWQQENYPSAADKAKNADQ